MKGLRLALVIWYVAAGATGVNAQTNDVIFQDLFEIHPFVYRPDDPLDVLFYCGLQYTDDGSPSQNTYYFDFDPNGDLIGGFTLDTGGFVTVNGDYTVNGGQIELSATNGFGADFDLTTEVIVPRLGMVGYFSAVGQALGRPGRMTCLAVGHGYDTATEVYERYECQDQPTAAGIYSNVIELSAFDSTINQFVLGAAFRQRDFYASGTTTGEPTLIERNDFGIFRRQGNLLYLDFTAGPLGLAFSDWNTAIADAGNDALAIDAFDPPLPPCQRAN